MFEKILPAWWPRQANWVRGVVSAMALVLLAAVGRAEGRPTALIDFGRADATTRVVASTPGEVTFARLPGKPGLVVTCRPGKDVYPGVQVKPAGKTWDLSGFGYVEARVTNTGTAPLTLCLRVDDDGDWTKNPWNAENVTPQPGETVAVRVRFGFSWGKPGYALNTARVARLLLFASKTKVEQSFRVETIVAGGAPGEQPPVLPADLRTRPRDGILLGKATAIDGATQLEATSGEAHLTSSGEGQAVRVRFAAASESALVRIKPAAGRWDLRDWLQVVVHARNTGAKPVRLRARLESAPDVTEWVTAPKEIAPGAAQEVTLPFAGSLITLAADGHASGGSPFESDRASGIAFSATGDGERQLTIDSIRAVTPPAPALPAWLGKRPPVPGAWKQTLAEEFNGPTVNDSVWTIYHPNYWDKQSHFSKANVILGGGAVRLRFENKRGHADDDPAKPETDWATGFLTTTHKWTQLYGYFECRMKLPHAPGMWPAFWMMPDRGAAAGAAREDTRNGGMEFDILEYLARYGPYRYNIACHWDGYEKDHKSSGSDRLYVQPDKEGFFTTGLLWEPGRLTFFCNGAPIARWEDPRVASVPEYILFTAVSGGWGGNDLTGAGLPDDLAIDYVRAWQRTDTPSTRAR